MFSSKSIPYFQAILAAILFGTSAPFAKLLLGEIDPLPLAGFLYLGSGLGSGIVLLIQRFQHNSSPSEAKIVRADIPWLLGAIIAGGVIAPIILLFGLKTTPAATASLLLNFESVATTLIAILIFKEAISRRIIIAMVLVTLASISLSYNTDGQWGFSLGALGVVGACLFWGFDNNFTRNISAKNPLVIVALKGFGAGSFSLLLSLILRNSLPGFPVILLSLVLGAFSYGLSIYLFILAMRNLGSARTSTLFGIAPFVGAILSISLLNEKPGLYFWISLPIILTGAFLMLSENHSHAHMHHELDHDHRHTHPDEHHHHQHSTESDSNGSSHSHWHKHEDVVHAHGHTPDIHHRHNHSSH